MGDRCYISLSCKRSDFAKHFEPLGFVIDERADGGGSVVEVYDEEANYGHYEELNDLENKGVVFFGEHGSGGCYTEQVFACDGTSVNWCPSVDRDPVARISEEGRPCADSMQRAKDYLKSLKAARDIFAALP